jgi:hypothetical protein
VFAVVATGWGPAFGGINAFSLALGRLLRGAARVVCITTPVDDITRAAAAKDGVEVLSVPAFHSGDPANAVQAATEVLRQQGIGHLDLTFGHDVFTGPAAMRLRTALCGTAAVIHLMSCGSYQAVKTDGRTARKREQEQRQVLQEADVVLAVGPLLSNSAQELCQATHEVHRLVPGLADIGPVTFREGSFRAIAFGRLGGADDQIKQGSLAAAGYGRFVREAHDLRLPYGYRFNVFGFSWEQFAKEEADLKAIVNGAAQRMVNVMASPYTENRQELFKELARNEVALMLSWHEGFGLVGWEAIAAQVPFVSRATGL